VSPPRLAPFVLTDTVGFIQKLPTQLVAAFKATLEELAEAALLMHVVDASHPRAREQMAAVYQVLGALGLEGRPTLVALNKIDRVNEVDGFVRGLVTEGAVPVSALTGDGLPALLQGIEAALRPTRVRCRFVIPYARIGVMGAVYERGRVLARRNQMEGIELEAEVPPPLLGMLAPYRTDGSAGSNGSERVPVKEAIR